MKVLDRGSIPISGIPGNKKQKIDQNCSILNVCKRQSVIPTREKGGYNHTGIIKMYLLGWEEGNEKANQIR